MSATQTQIQLGTHTVSRIGLGCMGLAGTWNPAEVTEAHIERAFRALDAALAAGITLFDHADIYGNSACETVFGAYLQAQPTIRERLYLTTKCGILFEDERGPQRYHLSYDHVCSSLEQSLRRLQTSYVDLYQIHRADPLAHPKETARALNQLRRDGRIRAVGVSNYMPSQVVALQAYLDEPIVSTQPEISLWQHEVLANGVLDQCMAEAIRPLAYSPLAGGLLAGRHIMSVDHPDAPRWESLLATLLRLSEAYGATMVQLSLAWLLMHPAGIIPLVGSVQPENIQEAMGALSVPLTREDWYVLWVAARNERLP